MATLYEIDANLRQLIETGFVFDDQTGEVFASLNELDEYEAAYKDKLEACAIWIKERKAFAEAIENEIKALQKRLKTERNKIDYMSGYVLSHMGNLEDGKLETPKVTVSTRRSVRTVITDETKLPDELVKVKTEITPDKTAIKKAIMSGHEVPGAELEDNISLQIR